MKSWIFVLSAMWITANAQSAHSNELRCGIWEKTFTGTQTSEDYVGHFRENFESTPETHLVIEPKDSNQEVSKRMKYSIKLNPQLGILSLSVRDPESQVEASAWHAPRDPALFQRTLRVRLELPSSISNERSSYQAICSLLEKE